MAWNEFENVNRVRDRPERPMGIGGRSASVGEGCWDQCLYYRDPRILAYVPLRLP